MSYWSRHFPAITARATNAGEINWTKRQTKNHSFRQWTWIYQPYIAELVRERRNYPAIYSTRKTNTECLYRKKKWKLEKRIAECIFVLQPGRSKNNDWRMEDRLQHWAATQIAELSVTTQVCWTVLRQIRKCTAALSTKNLRRSLRRYIGANFLVVKILEKQMSNNFKTLLLNCPEKGDAYK